MTTSRFPTFIYFALLAVVGWMSPHPSFASDLRYGPGGLPDLTTYPIGVARFDEMAAGLGSPISLDTDGTNSVRNAVFWIPAQGYAPPVANTPTQQAVQSASSGFFSRLRSQAVSTAAGIIPGVGGVVAGQAATGAIASATAVAPTNGQGTPGWWCRATYSASSHRLDSVACSPHAFTPLR